MLNLPNFITIIRILLVPSFVALLLRYRETGDEVFRWWAIGAFAAASASDALDGLMARRNSRKTILGSFLDPMADKLLLNTAVISLSLQMGRLTKFPSWFPILVISRDLIIVLGALLIHMLRGKVTPRPSMAGKFTTLFQMLSVIWVLLLWPHYLIPLSLAAALTLISGIEYICIGMQQLQAPPRP